MHAWVPWPCLPTGQIPDLSTGSAVRSESGYFQCPGSLVTSQDNLQCHNATVPLTTSHLLRLYPQLSQSSTPNQETFAVLSAAVQPLHPSWRRLTRQPRAREENVLAQRSNPDAGPPTPTPAPKFEAGVFNQLPFLGLVFNASRQMREVFTHRASKLMHGRVLDMSLQRFSPISDPYWSARSQADPPANQAEARTGGCQMRGLIIWSIEAK